MNRLIVNTIAANKNSADEIMMCSMLLGEWIEAKKQLACQLDKPK
jgi:hypothetical protein